MTDIDREVAKKVMNKQPDEQTGWFLHRAGGRDPEMFNPSTRIDHAWEVVEALHKHGSFLMLDYDEQRKLWLVSFERRRNLVADATGETAPLAICKAALAAVEAS